MKATFQIVLLFVAAALAAPSPNPDRFVVGSVDSCAPYKRGEAVPRGCTKYSEYEGNAETEASE